MKGFFEIETPKIKHKPNNKLFGCESCGLYKEVKSPKMPYTGEGRLNTFILGEGPGQMEDRKNKQFVGDSGLLLRTSLKELDYDLDRDFYKQNVIRCRPMDSSGNNRAPTKNEIQCCLPFWKQEIKDLKPRFIILFGAKAVEAFFNDHSPPITSDLSIGRWYKTCIPDKQTMAWVISLYHPSYAVRNPDFEVKFKQDLAWALNQLKRELPTFPDWKEFVVKITNYNDLISLFQDILKFKPPTVIDYETSGIRPYAKGHHIWSASIYPMFNEEDIEGGNLYSYAFPLSYPNHWNTNQLVQIENEFKKILADPKILKIAQSIRFEEIWSRRILKQPVQGWIHDTMICSHVIYEHRKFTGLDFQVFINWGYEYGEEIASFKNLTETGFTRMHEIPLHKLLEYNGLDSLFEGMLYQKQMETIG